jgi:hypothetical protein
LAIDGELAITPTALQLANQYVELCHRCHCRFYGQMCHDKGARLADRIIRHLHRNGGRMPHSPLLNRVSTHGECNATEFQDALAVLGARGEIRFDAGATRFPDVVLATEPLQDSPDSTHQSGNGDGSLPVGQDGEHTTVPPTADQIHATPGLAEAVRPAPAEAMAPPAEAAMASADRRNERRVGDHPEIPVPLPAAPVTPFVSPPPTPAPPAVIEDEKPATTNVTDVVHDDDNDASLLRALHSIKRKLIRLHPESMGEKRLQALVTHTQIIVDVHEAAVGCLGEIQATKKPSSSATAEAAK